MRNFAFAAAAAVGLLVASAAGAETLDVTYVGDGHNWSWEQSSNPTVIGYVAGQDTFVPVTDATAGLRSPVAFFSLSSGGGFSDGEGFVHTHSNPALYTGAEANPVFSVGSFILTNAITGSPGGTITFTAATAPEPATWGLMLLGFAGLGALALRRGDWRRA
jgi:hypothetical protein